MKAERRNILLKNKFLEKDIRKKSEKVVRLRKGNRRNNINLAKVKRTCQLLRKAIIKKRRNVMEVQKSIADLFNHYSQSDYD